MMFKDTLERVAAFKKPEFFQSQATSKRSNSGNLRSASDIENSSPAKIPPHQNFQSVTAPQKQGGSQAAKKPRANTPNTSRKVIANSLQVAAVNSVKNHTDSDDFVVQNTVQIAGESLSWNQVTGMTAGKHHH